MDGVTPLKLANSKKEAEEIVMPLELIIIINQPRELLTILLKLINV